MSTALPVWFHDDYAPADQPHFARLAAVAAALRREAADIREPPVLDPLQLEGLHDAAYVAAFLRGIAPLAVTSYLRWSPSLMQTCLRMLGGQLAAAQAARTHGVSFNLACGFHHAHPAHGGGFCVFNGLALVAQHFRDWQVAVLDCDEHGADGTEAFCERLPNLRQVSIFGTRFGVRGGTRSRAIAVAREPRTGVNRRYLTAVDNGLAELLSERTDLLIYQAGMDSHRDDPKSTLKLSADALQQRDRRVFHAAHRAAVPVLVVLGGCYQEPQRGAQLYLATWRAALEANAARAPARTRANVSASETSGPA